MTSLTQFKDLIVETLNDNKKLILIAYAIFIISFILAAVFSGSLIDNALSDIPNSTDSSIDTQVTATELFIQNERGGILIYFASIFFGIASVLSLVYNGLNIGMAGSLLVNFMPKGWAQYILYLIPHGIFEITALILQSVAGILLFLFIWRFIKSFIKSEKNGFKEKALNAYGENKKKLIQSLVLMIVGTILLLIAAPIEAYVSVPFSEFILGI